MRSQLLSTQATLTTAQREIDGYRKREQQEELQIAEIKMMMHQVKHKHIKCFRFLTMKLCVGDHHQR